jgi:photosystem II stability/assembly factor-like uncharacterized protein
MKRRIDPKLILLSLLSVLLVCLVSYFGLRNTKQRTHSHYSGAYEALTFWTKSRAYPEKDIPQDKYYRAYELAAASIKSFSAVTKVSNIWEPIGPINLHGRSISVALNPLNPKTVYLGTASGGLWRSFTGALINDWQQIKLGFPALGIGAIAIDPVDTNTMYIGTGEVYDYQRSVGGVVIRTTRGSYGIGILKTTDGGNTWTKSLDWTCNQQRGVARLAVNPLNNGTIFAATTEGVFKSTDKGTTWNNILPVLLAKDIIINSLDTNKILASCGNFASTGHGLYRSTNAGSTWSGPELSTFSGKTMICACSSNPDIVFASAADSTTGYGELWKTTNFGIDWNQMSTSGTNDIFGVQGWYSHYVIVNPTNPNLIIHNSVGLSKSTDGGITFTQVSSAYPDNHSFAIDPTNPDIVYIVNDDGIYRTTNFGTSYTDVGFGLQTGQFYNGFSNSATDSFLAVGQSQDHIPGYKYSGNMVWDRSAVDETGWTTINPANDNIIYAVYRFGQQVYKSANRGVSFSGSSAFTAGSWNSPLVISPSNTNILYFGTYFVYKTTNSGSSWFTTNNSSTLDGNPALSIAISSTNPDTVFIGMAPLSNMAHVFRTTNGGTTWNNVTSILPNRYPMDIAVDPKNSRIVYSVFGGFSSGHVFKSTDAGSNWMDITGSLPDIPTTAIAIDTQNTNNLYVGNDFGIYISTDAGNSWMSFNEGLPDAIIVADLSISKSNRKLRVATHGNGVYERDLFNGTFPPSFDYRSLTFTFPTASDSFYKGYTIYSLTASFKNSGTQAQTDSFDVEYRILFNNNEVFSSTKKIAGLKLSEIKQVTFDSSFTFFSSGTYTIQAISLATDQIPGNDTLMSEIKIISLPNITSANATKEYSPYTEISSGTSGPNGDDVQKRIALPFTFEFDNYQYDSLQISTNGWIEFGTGTSGSLRGLSTSDQIGAIGANENGRFGTPQRPTKALAVWLDDLNTDAAGSQITYTTLQSAPDRIFVVQWKNIRAYYSSSTTTTLINFQVRLYETSNMIELNYGPVTLGTFGGTDTGAMIGLKDHFGGNYHIYDIAGNGNFVTPITTDLSPLTDWPGPDSCYRINANKPYVYVALKSQWNLISVPLLQVDSSVQNIYPTATYNTTYSFEDDLYKQKSTLLPGIGYWTKFPSNINQKVIGSELNSLNIPVKLGWNIIGCIDHEVPAPTGEIISSQVYGYENGYQIAETLIPGKGYWIKTNSPGILEIGGSPLSKAARLDITSLSEIKISDNIGRHQTLYVGSGTGSNTEQYVMPPLPPNGIFDARFSSGLLLEGVKENSLRELNIRITSATFPVTVDWKNKNLNLSGWLLVNNRDVPLDKDLSFQLPNNDTSDVINLILKIKNAGELPRVFSLKQNYPNPFNPNTTIKYDLPRGGFVTIEIFDVLGRKITTLINGMQDAGFKTVDFVGSNYSSGVYFYKVQVKESEQKSNIIYNEIKKMILIK